MLKKLKSIWNDSVFSNVIAGLILVVLLAIVTRLWPRMRWEYPVPVWLVVIVVAALAGLSLCCVSLGRNSSRSIARLAVISKNFSIPTGPQTLIYPFKYYVEFRNDSPGCIDVHLSEYRPNAITLKKFVPNVLQLHYGKWIPEVVGAERIAVLPGQRFRAWIGIDEAKYTLAQAERLVGHLGELILMVDGKPISYLL